MQAATYDDAGTDARDYRVIVKVKNARLLRAMEGAGIRSQSELARRANISASNVGAVANLTVAAMKSDGDWRKAVLDISSVLRCMPEDIVPDAHRYNALTKNVVSFDTDLETIGGFIDAQADDNLERLTDIRLTVSKALNGLTARERGIVERRFGLSGYGESTYQEIGKEYGICGQRIRQIEQKAIRKLRHPKNILSALVDKRYQEQSQPQRAAAPQSLDQGPSPEFTRRQQFFAEQAERDRELVHKNWTGPVVSPIDRETYDTPDALLAHLRVHNVHLAGEY